MNASNSIHKSFCQFIYWCFTFRIPKVQHQCFPRNSFTQHSRWLLHAPIWQEHIDCSLFCAKAESHNRAQTRSSIFKPRCQFFCATFQFSNPHWKSSLSNIHLFLWHLSPVFSTSSAHPTPPSECIGAFLSITDGHIFISHHADLQSILVLLPQNPPISAPGDPVHDYFRDLFQLP